MRTAGKCGISGLFTLLIIGVYDAQAAAPEVVSGKGPVETYLRELFAKGECSGNTGDVYRNMDGEHAKMRTQFHPQFEAAPPEKPELGKILTWPMVPDKKSKPTLFNASLVANHCSVVRQAMVSPKLAANAYDCYMNNTVWFHPAHLDYWNPTHKNEKVDIFPAMFPYMIATVGSSGSELDEMAKIGFALAAFKPAVKKKLIENGLLMPTLQMAFRRSRVASEDDYLTYKAHPTAFDNMDNTLDMVKLVQAVQMDTVPPMVQLFVTQENFEAREKLFDTPASIARKFEKNSGGKSIGVTALKSYDVNKRPLTYHWSVIRGNDKLVRITKMDSKGSSVRIDFANAAPGLIPDTDVSSHLLVVACFVNNGAYYSAPGFVTVNTLANK